LRGYNLILLLLAIGAVLSMLFQGLMLLFMISIVGIPLAIVMAALPALALVLILARLVQRLVLDRVFPPVAGPVTGGVAVVLVLALLTAIAALDRRGQAAVIANLTAEDMNALSPPLPKGVVAIRSGDPDSACNDLCRRLLVTGSAGAVLLQRLEDPALPVDPASAAVSYRLEARASCPEPALDRDGDFLLKIADEAASPGAAPASSVVLRGRIAQGTCLIDAPARLGEAEVVITRARLSEMPQADSAGFQWGTALITADRLSVHLREGAGFRETYRWTGGVFSRMWPVAIPVPTFGYGFNTGIGFGRWETTFNTEDQFYEAPDWPGFLTGTLGLPISLTGLGAGDTRAAIRAVLDRPGQIGDSDLSLIRGYLEGVDSARFYGRLGGATYRPDPDDRALYLRLLQDRRIPLSYAMVSAMPKPEELAEAELAALAEAAFARLIGDEPWMEEQAQAAGDILAKLPAATLAPYRDTLFQLTEDRERRWPSLALLTRLADFGDEGAARLVFLIGDAQRETWEENGNMWQHPTLAGLIGLCRMGPAAASQRGAVDALIAAGKVTVSDSGYGRLTVHMLVALGYAPAEVAAVRDRSADPMPAPRLQNELKRAGTEVDCGY
jgi:hypothetical protein